MSEGPVRHKEVDPPVQVEATAEEGGRRRSRLIQAVGARGSPDRSSEPRSRRGAKWPAGPTGRAPPSVLRHPGRGTRTQRTDQRGNRDDPGEYKAEENTEAYCTSPAGQDPNNTTYTSYASHNPTVLPDLAFIDWHSSGLQAVDITDPTNPTTAGFFVPEPLPSVVTEDPALSRGVNKVVMWSYPIIYKGLIYAIDIRNGLYILRYTGPHADEVGSIGVLGRELESGGRPPARSEPVRDAVQEQRWRGGVGPTPTDPDQRRTRCRLWLIPSSIPLGRCRGARHLDRGAEGRIRSGLRRP